jgi:hypothetical protein
VTYRDLIATLADLTQSACQQASGGRTDTCILSTHVLIEACRYHGIAASPLPVRVLVANAAAWEAIRDGIVMDEWPSDAHTVGFDDRHPDALGPRAGRWPGHLVAAVKPGGGEPRVLVDAAFAQFARPERGLLVEPWLAAEFPAPWSDECPLVGGMPGGGGVVYGPTSGVLSSGWRYSPDWVGDVKGVVAAVIRASK